MHHLQRLKAARQFCLLTGADVQVGIRRYVDAFFCYAATSRMASAAENGFSDAFASSYLTTNLQLSLLIYLALDVCSARRRRLST